MRAGASSVGGVSGVFVFGSVLRRRLSLPFRMRDSAAADSVASASASLFADDSESFEGSSEVDRFVNSRRGGMGADVEEEEDEEIGTDAEGTIDFRAEMRKSHLQKIEHSSFLSRTRLCTFQSHLFGKLFNCTAIF
jgi:hypothetical protein